MRFFYAKYETFEAVFHCAYLIGRSYQHFRQPYIGLSPIRLGAAKTARESAKSPDLLDSKLAPDDQNPFPGLTGRLSRLPETCARGQEAVNLLQNTPKAHSPALVNCRNKKSR
jgi:hypothetical protein